jgi:hypothetical protein
MQHQREMKKALSIVILLCFSFILRGQTTFAKKYTPSPFYAIAEGANNSIYSLNNSGGTTVLAHLDSNGDTIWAKKYICTTCIDGIYPAWGLSRLKDGNLLIVQSKWHPSPVPEHSTLIKIDTAGTVLWAKTHSYCLNPPIHISEGNDSSIYLCGLYGFMKTDKNGNIKWNRPLSFSGPAYMTGIASVNNGVVMSGYCYFVSPSNMDIILFQADTAGNIVWNKRYDGSQVDQALSVIVASDSSLIVAGSTHAEGAGWYDAFIMKTDNTGNPLWLKTYGDETGNRGEKIIEEANGDLVLLGHTYYSTSATIAHTLLIKTDGSGTPHFTKSYGDSTNQEGRHIFISDDNGYVISASNGTIIKTDSAGYLDCFMYDEVFTTDTPPFINNVPYTIIDTIVPVNSYTETYTVSYKAVNYVPFCSTTGSDEIDATAFDMSIAPNPFSQLCTISFGTEQKNTTIKIIDVLGKEIRSFNFTGKELILDRSALKEGIYFLQAITETKHVATKKIVIQ